MVVVLCGILFQAKAQTNLKQKKFIANRDTVFLDSLSLIPGSVQLRQKRSPIDTSVYKINYKLKALIFKTKTNDTLIVAYKTFPYNFEKTYAHKTHQYLAKIYHCL